MIMSTERLALITGLGNPGREYENTRHNAGFAAVDSLPGILPGTYNRHEGFSGVFWKGRFKGEMLFIQKPMTYMNLSGKAVAGLMSYHKIAVSELLLIYDDLDLPFGRIRIRKGGGSGGHKGVESVIAETGSSDFVRLRIGIGRPEGREGIDYVLSGFSEEEKLLFPKIIGKAAEAVRTMLYRGINKAMNEVNGVPMEFGDTDKNKNSNITDKQNITEE
ncbi:MAG: aminoacyl-tRNA hydrolase [Lentisphaerae bacterium GWF2_44_16]|nr:MAG: aminoacyl-tRNA hydrolase [Lentisphaerae bacterium GWF2_44_16]